MFFYDNSTIIERVAYIVIIKKKMPHNVLNTHRVAFLLLF